MRTESDLLVLLEELSSIKWYVIGVCEVKKKLSEEQKILNDGHLLYWRGKPQGSKQELGIGFFIHKRLEKNIVEFYSVSEGVASVTMKPNNRYNLKIIQVNAQTCSYNDEEIGRFYEDVHLASERVKTHFTITIGNFNAKIGKNTEETVIGNHGIGTRNERGQMLVDFAEARSLNIMNTFFEKRHRMPNVATLKIRATEFSLNIQNRYSLLDDEDLNNDKINKQFNDIIKEAALKVGGKNDKQSSSKLSI
ncbi:craniofacial development protein 2-like [Penaeus vannamei]|uniref:craniofacial development protein 2-like n=1 Tax=Penaeus vannamei TaxID=6689 RepID=UPI00387F7051